MAMAMYVHFGLTLMVNHACNLRCKYCYTGAKFRQAMPLRVAQRAVDRAIQSLTLNGTLELGFFGGEPLIESELIIDIINYAISRAEWRGCDVVFNMTTNGTIVHPKAWKIITNRQMNVAISHDGLSVVHDTNRIGADGHASSAIVEETIHRIVDEEIEFRVVSVVRPDTVLHLPEGMEFLQSLGVRRFDPSLDLWAAWTRDDVRALTRSIASCADLWANWLPDTAISWFDRWTGQIYGVASTETARCSFGAGEIAVAPSGNLYPCERLIGEDRSDNRMRLPGHALDGDDFLEFLPAPTKSAVECNSCSLQSVCATDCRCSNYVRTGDVTRPDGLLCWFEQACFRETARVLADRTVTTI